MAQQTQMKAQSPVLRLHDGIEIPQLGFGVFQVPPEETQAAVEMALEAGYRHIDTAAAYGNEKGVGAALAASGLPREDYFVTTKLWNSQQGEDSALAAFEASLDRLGLDHVDLYLIHWPVPSEDRFVDTWRAFEQIHREEAARTIGVSNFRIEDLERLERETEKRPTINQVELHPHFQQADLRAWHTAHGMATEAWSPLAQGALLEDETIGRLAEDHGKTAAQVILRWHIFDFELSEGEMVAMGALDRGSRIGPEPATFVAP